MSDALAALEVVELPLEVVHGASWNANVVDLDTRAKIRLSLRRFGIIENSVVRPLPKPCSYCGEEGEQHFEVVSGNHRREIYIEEGLATLPAAIKELDDAQARVLAEALNRTRGTDDEEKQRALYRDVIDQAGIEALIEMLPETRESIQKLLSDVPPPADEPSYSAPDLWGVVVDCDNETDQAQLLERLTEEGFKCRALML